MSKCSFATVEIRTFEVAPGHVGDANANIVVGTDKKQVQICTTHQFVRPLSPSDVGHSGLTEDLIVLDCSTAEATKYHRVSF